jgi:Mitochondrial K+-H+ exchange-related
MDVYFIPVGPDRYELYCDEAGDPEDAVADVQATGRFASLYQKFKAALARVEQERLSGETKVHEGPRSWTERMKDRALCWLAEKIAEQRLLWRLRNQTQVEFFYPDDMEQAKSLELARAELQREADRHLKWVIIDGTIFVASGVVALVPGPNVLAYYFGFRLVGHYLSRRGAKHGLTDVQWLPCPSTHLSRLRRAISLHEPEREREVHEVASELHLPHLAKFFERTSMKTA